MDKLLGIAFSIIKIGLVVGLVILLFEALNTRYELVPQAILDKSVLYKPVKEVADVVFPYMKELIFKK